MFLAVYHGVDVVGREFDRVAVSNRIRGARFDAIAAENATGIIDVVDLGVSLAGRDTIFLGIFGGFNVNAIRGARGGAKEAANAFLETVFVALKDMNPAISGLNRRRCVGEAFRGRLAEHCAESDAKALAKRGGCFEDFLNDGWHKN